MLASLALISLLQAPTIGADGLSLANPRFTHGVLGPVRADSKVRPGDSLVLSFDLQGISTDDAGKAAYTTAVEVTDAKGKAIYSQPARKIQEFLPLGGGSLPAFAQIDLSPDSPAGEYSLKVTATDSTGAKSAATTQKFEVLPKAFDLVHLTVTGDADGLIPAGAFCVGQPFWFHASVVGFDRSTEGTSQPKVSLSLRVLDENGKPIVAKPFVGSVDKEVPSKAIVLPVRFFVPLNKAGKYTVEITAQDDLKKGNAATKQYPLTVLPLK